MRGFLKALGILAVLLLVVVSAAFLGFAEAYRIPGNAMKPSLRPGDRVLVIRFVGPVKPDRHEIVAYEVQGERCGSGRESVFVHRIRRRDHVGRFIMRGDNGGESCDSRVLGPVPRGDLIGQVVAVYWPPNRWGFR